ncbi:MAG: hypothetical protein AAGH46_01780 [Bacteroidota bacterium]
MQFLRPFILSLIVIAIIANIFDYTNLTDLVLIVTIQSSIVSAKSYPILLVAESVVINIVYRHYQVSLYPNNQEQIEVEKKPLRLLELL